MKILLLVTLHVAFCLPILAQQRPDKNLNDMRGAVHTVRTTVSYDLKKAGKVAEKGSETERHETYDRQGNLSAKRSIFGTSADRSLFSRDAQGNRIEKLTVLPSPDPNAPPPPPPPAHPERDKEGFLDFITAYQFDAAKNRLEATKHRRSGELLWIDTYIFDEKGLLIESARKDSTEAAYGSKSKFTYKRNEQGIKTESISYDATDGKVSERTLYQNIEVDKQGNWIKRTETTQSAKGTNYPILTTVRQITYY